VASAAGAMATAASTTQANVKAAALAHPAPVVGGMLAA